MKKLLDNGSVISRNVSFHTYFLISDEDETLKEKEASAQTHIHLKLNLRNYNNIR